MSRHNLPASTTSFIGRKDLMAQISLLLKEKRLVTLTGAGGTGKTRLALEVAANEIGNFAEGAWLVELAPLSGPEFILETVLKTLQIDQAPGKSLEETLLTFLKARQLLLVLDNCEHLKEECGRLTAILLANCSQLKILTSSREPLSVYGEWVVRVPSLGVPDSYLTKNLEVLAECEAVRLFVERARAAEPGFILNGYNAGAVAEICIRLDGIPLALELAAGRLRGLGVGQLASRLATTFNVRFRFLANSSPTGQPRQQTLLALIEWSYNLLNEREQVVFQRLAIFTGSWELEAAEAVCAGDFQTADSQDRIEPEEIIDLLAQLSNKSLVQLDQEKGRFSMLETIRLFAHNKLEENGELETLKSHHFNWFLDLAESGLGNLGGPKQAEWFKRLEDNHPNFRSALGWAIDRGEAEKAARLALALWNFWLQRIYHGEAIAWLEQIAALPGLSSSLPLPLQAHLCNALGSLYGNIWEIEKARYWNQQELNLWEQVGDRKGIATAFLSLGWESFNEVNLEQSRHFAQKALALAREVGEKRLIGSALNLYMVSSIETPYFDGLKESLEESLAIWQELDDRPGLASVLDVYTRFEEKSGNLAGASQRVVETIKLRQELGDYLGFIGSFVNLLHLSMRIIDQPQGAKWVARVLGVVTHWGESIGGQKLSPWHAQESLGMARQAEGVIGKGDFENEFAAGKSLTMPEIASLAEEIARSDLFSTGNRLVEAVQPAPSSLPGTSNQDKTTSFLPALPAGLSRREAEILRLVAAGLSNPEIGQKLIISPRTVDAHLRSIFAKIEVNTRSAATRFALEHNLV